MPQINTTLPEGLTPQMLKSGEELDLRVIVENGGLVVTKVLRHTKAGQHSADYKARLGAWNRK
jgi:hypothetical protein